MGDSIAIHTMHYSSRVLVVAVTLLSVAAFAADSTEFEAHRMIQYDRGNAAFGSRKTYVGALAGTLESSSLEKKVAMLHMDEVTDELIDQIINGSLGTAVLIILPEDMLALDDSAIALWRGFERKLLLSSTPIPVYFAFKGSEVAEIYDRVAAAGSTSDGYQLMVSNPEARPISPVHAVNIQGWLPGVGADHGAAADHLPTLAIVAHYDTFGVAPSLAVGAGDNASGVVALLELARLFSKLYRRLHTQGKYNLVFVLTGAGRLNFSGTKHWLEQADIQLLENIEFALCLDAIGSGDGLYFHISKPPKDPEITKMYTEFKQTAGDMGIPFDVTHRKIDLSDPEVYWQHEQFSRKRVLAATLSHQASAKPATAHASILDRKVDLPTLYRNIKFVAEVIARHVYELPAGESLNVFKDSLALNEQFIKAWHGVIAQEDRMQVVLTGSNKDPKSVKLILGLERALSEYTEAVRPEVFTVDSPMKFYDVSRVKMAAYKVKPVTFDLVFAVLIIMYLVGVLVLLQGFGPAIAEIKGVLMGGKNSKSKKGKQ